jgi:hypothetical protein
VATGFEESLTESSIGQEVAAVSNTLNGLSLLLVVELGGAVALYGGALLSPPLSIDRLDCDDFKRVVVAVVVVVDVVDWIVVVGLSVVLVVVVIVVVVIVVVVVATVVSAVVAVVTVSSSSVDDSEENSSIVESVDSLAAVEVSSVDVLGTDFSTLPATS